MLKSLKEHSTKDIEKTIEWMKKQGKELNSKIDNKPVFEDLILNFEEELKRRNIK